MGPETRIEDKFDSEIIKVRDDIYKKISHPLLDADKNTELLLVESARDQVGTNGTLQMWAIWLSLFSFLATSVALLYGFFFDEEGQLKSISAFLFVYLAIAGSASIVGGAVALKVSSKEHVSKMWIGKAVELILMHRGGNGTPVLEKGKKVKSEEIKMPESSSSLKVSVEIQRG